MPRAPLKPCAEPLCPQLVRAGRCYEHDLKRRYYAARPRGSSTQQGYGAAWRKVRALVLHRDPFCTDPSGCTRPSTDVDHVIARKRGGSDDMSNLRGLCRSHHSRKTALTDGRWGRSDNSVVPATNERLAPTTRALPDWPRGVQDATTRR